MKNTSRLGLIALSMAIVLVIGLVFAAHSERNMIGLLTEMREFVSRYGSGGPPTAPPHPGVTLNPQSEPPQLTSRYGADKPGPGAPANPGVGMNKLPGLPLFASRYGTGGPPAEPPRPGIS